MKLLSLVVALCGIAGGVSADAVPATQPTVAIAALQVNRPLPPQLNRISQGIPRRQPYTTPDRGGVDLSILVTVPGRQIVATRDDALQIQTFVDDRYNDLGRQQRNQGYGGNAMNISDDGAATMLTINSERGPAAEATRMFVRGSVTLRCAVGAQTSERMPLKLRVGQKVEAGPVPLLVRSITSAGAGNIHVSLEGNRTLEQIRSVRVFGADGKELRTGNEAASYVGRAATTMTNITVPENIDEVTIEVTYVERLEMVTIPFELLIDLGAIKVGQPTTRPVSATDLGTGRAGVVPRSGSRSFPPRADAGTAPWPPPAGEDVFAFATTRPAFAWPTPPAVPESWPAGVGGKAVGRPTTLPATGVRAVSLTVNQSPETAVAESFPGRADFNFRQNGGTIVRMMLSLQDRMLLSVEPGRVRVERFADDTGKELRTALHESMQGYSASYAGLRSILASTDGKNVLMNLHMEDTPTPNATRILLKGTITAHVARKEIVAEQKDVSLEAGTVVKAGAVELRVNSLYLLSQNANLPDTGPSVDPKERRVAVRMRSNVSPETIKRIQVIDADGQEVPVTIVRQSPYPDNVKEYTLECQLARDAKRATVRVTYYDQIETLNVPFELAAGVGL